MTTSVLYVCTYWGVRSQIAGLLTNAQNHPELVVQCAGFESGTIGELPRRLMKDRGLELSSESPDTIFKFARNKADLDYVVTLCSQDTQENYTVLYDVVKMLFSAHAEIIHWNVPDFMSIAAVDDAQREKAAKEIVNSIESEVCEFIKQIRNR